MILSQPSALTELGTSEELHIHQSHHTNATSPNTTKSLMAVASFTDASAAKLFHQVGRRLPEPSWLLLHHTRLTLQLTTNPRSQSPTPYMTKPLTSTAGPGHSGKRRHLERLPTNCPSQGPQHHTRNQGQSASGRQITTKPGAILSCCRK